MSEKKTRFECDACGYVTGNKRLLALHKKRTHFAATECGVCGRRFDRYKAYVNHLKTHEGAGKRFECPEPGCGYSSHSRAGLKSHALTHSRDVPLLRCGECDFTCKRTSELNRHKTMKHSIKGGKVLSCPHCDYTTPSSQHLKRHTDSAHRKAKTAALFHCRLCAYTCSTVDTLRKHLLRTRVHEGAAVYACPECEWAGNAAAGFGAHLAAEHPERFSSQFEAADYVKRYFYKNSDL